jgi:hypothetical protein
MLDAKSLWAEVQENSRNLRACKRHRFERETVTLGMKINCLNCGGYLRLTDIGQYIAGYEAAGGTATDIWPAYKEPAP